MNYSDQPRPSLFRCRRHRRRRRRGGMDKNVEDHRVFFQVSSLLVPSTGTTQLVIPRLDAALTRPSNSRPRSSSLAISQLSHECREIYSIPLDIHHWGVAFT